jgi:hypothetical protein
MIELLRNSEFANKFKYEIYPFKYSMIYIEARKNSANSVIQLKYFNSDFNFNSSKLEPRLVAIAECLYKNDKLLKLIIRSVEPEIVKQFIELYSIRDYSYVFIYNRYAQDSYYTDVVKAYEYGNNYCDFPKNTESVKILADNILFVMGDDNCQSVSDKCKLKSYHVIWVATWVNEYNEYWKDKIDFLLGLADVVVADSDMHFHDRVLKNKPNHLRYNVVLFLESLNRKSSTKSARKTMPI